MSCLNKSRSLLGIETMRFFDEEGEHESLNKSRSLLGIETVSDRRLGSAVKRERISSHDRAIYKLSCRISPKRSPARFVSRDPGGDIR